MLIQTALTKITQCVMFHLQEVGPVELGGRRDLVEGNVKRIWKNLDGKSVCDYKIDGEGLWKWVWTAQVG